MPAVDALLAPNETLTDLDSVFAGSATL